MLVRSRGRTRVEARARRLTGKSFPARPVLCLILALAAVVACGPRSPTPHHYTDLIATGELYSPLGRIAPEDVHCPDVTRLGVALDAGEELSALVSFETRAQLHVGICSPAAAGDSAAAPAGEVRIEIESAAVPALEKTRSLSVTGGGSAEAVVDLSELAGNNGRLRLRTFARGGRQVLLYDLDLSHEVAVPAARAVRQVLLISIDTLREDAITALGGSGPTPNLDRFIAESQVWSPHYATATWTKPSHAGLMTGQNARVHRVYSGDDGIPASVKSLAQRFRDESFSTAALVFDCVNLEPRFGFARGFDQYRVVNYRLPKGARALSNWLVEHRDDSFFLFFHTYDSHSDFHQIPYEAPGVTTESLASRFSVRDYGCRKGVCSSQLLAKLKDGSIPMIEGESRILEYLYRRSVADVDRHLGSLFDNLRAAGMWDQMTILLTSDHGEAFRGPGRILHGSHWEEIVRVPLVIKWPGGESGGDRRTLPTSAVDLAPTLAEAYALDASDLPGTSLLQKRRSTPIFAGTYSPIVIEGGYKAVFEEDRTLLFDLQEDPLEARDVSAQRPEVVRRLEALKTERQRLDDEIFSRVSRGHEEKPVAGLTPEEIQRLQALGYLND